MKYILGIDPGASGGFAILSRSNPTFTVTIAVEKCTPKDIYSLLYPYAQDIAMAYLEKVGSMPGNAAQRMFNFGVNYGTYIGLLTALHIPFTHVLPVAWQKNLGCLSKGDKNVTKRKAQELFPRLSITHAIADALLIAEYGRRKISQVSNMSESNDSVHLL